jgi:hypothetical protein
LDFLGFSRPNRDLSMGCAGFSAKAFSSALTRREKPERALKLEAFWRARLFMGQAYINF